MTDQPNCLYTDDSDIEQRYLAGKLSETDAEEFERHYFECDACWSDSGASENFEKQIWIAAAADPFL